MIQDSKLEYCVIAEYSDGYKFCIAKFMHEEDARRYRRSRKKDFVVYRLYKRFDSADGITWTEL